MAWDLLYLEYHGGKHVRLVKLQNLIREFEYTRMRDNETLSNYLPRLNELINQMKTFGEVLSKERQVQKVLITGIGSLKIDTEKGRKYIREVMYLPGLKENLLSVGHMDQHGYCLVFGEGMCRVFDSLSMDYLIIKVPMKSNRCYPVSFLADNQLLMKTSFTQCTWMWHKRLGHLNFKGLK
ncbi:unnamed protein product [Prunus brigantina]